MPDAEPRTGAATKSAAVTPPQHRKNRGIMRISGRIGNGPGVLEALKTGPNQPSELDEWRAAMNGTRKNTEESFWGLVSPTGFCWTWTGEHTEEGYGYYCIDNTTKGVHRIAFRLLMGWEPDAEMHIDHLCRTRDCCNPDHLEVVTAAENSRRANRYKIERTHCTHGHEWTPENTLALNVVSKRCRQCILVRTHRSRGKECAYDNFCGSRSHRGPMRDRVPHTPNRWAEEAA